VRTNLERTARNFFELDTEMVRSLAPPNCPKDFLDTALFCCAYEPTSRPSFHEILILLLSVNMSHVCDEENARNIIRFEEIQIDDVLAERLTETLNETYDFSITEEEQAQAALETAQLEKIEKATSPSKSLTKFMSAPSIFALDEYLRVESMVDKYTMWNVRIATDATVKDVIEKVAKKLDEKYKVIQLYLLNGKKKVLLGSHQIIADIKATWESDKKTYKFGVNYFESDDDPTLHTGAKNTTTLLRVARKDSSLSILMNRRSALFNKEGTKAKKVA